MNPISYYKEMLEVNPKWLGVQAKEMLAHYTELEAKLDVANNWLNANGCSKEGSPHPTICSLTGDSGVPHCAMCRLEAKLEISEQENRTLRINTSQSVLRRLTLQEAIRPFGYCIEHGRSIHPEETECPICGRELREEPRLDEMV